MTEESVASDPMMAGTYETTVEARALDPEFRVTALYQFDQTCAVSSVDHPALLDVAHIFPWSDYPEYRADLQNVLPLSKIHHAAFGREPARRSVVRASGNEFLDLFREPSKSTYQKGIHSRRWISFLGLHVFPNQYPQHRHFLSVARRT